MPGCYVLHERTGVWRERKRERETNSLDRKLCGEVVVSVTKVKRGRKDQKKSERTSSKEACQKGDKRF
jgi:hypothetical protein